MQTRGKSSYLSMMGLEIYKNVFHSLLIHFVRENRVYFFIVHNIYNKLRKDYMQLDYIVQEEVRRVLNEIYKRSNNSILELGANAVSKKKKYAKTLWNKIQQVYSYLGGCKSFDSINGDDGFTDFLYGNYVWRIYFGDSAQDIKAATIYKPTQYGRTPSGDCATPSGRS